MNRAFILLAASALVLTACTSSNDTDVSAAPQKPKDFCHAMQAAADVAPTAADALDTLFTTIDALAASATAADITELNAAGEATVTASGTYADALTTAAELAPDTKVQADITTLKDYWVLYASGLGQVAQSAGSYGDLVDQSQALVTSEEAQKLVDEQPAAQDRINAAYLGTCAG